MDALDDDLYQRLRAVVAEKHNVLLSKDDPILATVTINRVVLDEYFRLALERLDGVNEKAALQTATVLAQAKDLAARLINESADYLKKSQDKATDETVRRIREVVEDSIRKGTVRSGEDAQTAKDARRGAVIAAIIAAFAAVAAIGVALGALATR